jgi:hypothetical protein
MKDFCAQLFQLAGSLLQASFIDRLDIEAPVATNLEARQHVLFSATDKSSSGVPVGTLIACQRRLNVDPSSLKVAEVNTDPPCALLTRGSARTLHP